MVELEKSPNPANVGVGRSISDGENLLNRSTSVSKNEKLVCGLLFPSTPLLRSVTGRSVLGSNVIFIGAARAVLKKPLTTLIAQSNRQVFAGSGSFIGELQFGFVS